MSTYIIADTHLDHKRVLYYDSRPWTDVHLMNLQIILNIKETISKEDTLIHLGDVALTSKERYIEWLKLMKSLCAELIVIWGNHDPKITNRVWREANVEVTKEPIIIDNTILSHFPLIEFKQKINYHGHSHKSATDKRHCCVSCNLTNYKPILLKG